MTQPVRRVQAGACSASVFVNEMGDGPHRKRFHSVSLQRSYKDNTGGVRYTSNLKPGDLVDAITVLEQAREFLEAERAQRRLGDEGEDGSAVSKPKTV